MEKKIAIVAHGSFGLTASILAKLGSDIEVITPDQALERGINITSISEPEPMVIKPSPLIEAGFFNQPLSRRERRAKERKNKR